MSTYYKLDQKFINPFAPTQILIETLKKYKINYIDATQCVSDHQKEGTLYYNDDNHFTKLGQQVFSDCISDTLGMMIKSMINR